MITQFLALIALAVVAMIIVILALCVLVELFLRHIAAGEPDVNGDPERDAAGMRGSPAYHGAAREAHCPTGRSLRHAKSTGAIGNDARAGSPSATHVSAPGSRESREPQPQSSVPPSSQRRRLAEGRIWA